ncbi:MAG: Flp family type IVb pilin [Bryobacteraceae bacterium]|jgi:Flp pilus assembly pilin Flp
MDFLGNCFRDERGQDIVEYALLLAFVVLTSAALFYSGRANIQTIWTATNNNLSAAAISALPH